MLCVEWGSTNTGWHINVHHMELFFFFFAHKLLSVKLNTMEILEWGTYGLNEWDSQRQRKLFLEEICSKSTGLHGSSLPHDHMSFGHLTPNL